MVGIGRGGQKREIGKVTPDHLTPRQAGGEADDHRDERKHDDSDHHLDDAVEELRSAASGLVEIVHVKADPEEDRDDGPLGAFQETFVRRVEIEEVLLNGGGSQRELGHGPHNVGHDGGDEPGPTEEGIEVLVDQAERALLGG